MTSFYLIVRKKIDWKMMSREFFRMVIIILLALMVGFIAGFLVGFFWDVIIIDMRPYKIEDRSSENPKISFNDYFLIRNTIT